MAVGGDPASVNLEQISNNIQEQYDEILALQAIFEGDEDRLTVLSSAAEMGNVSRGTETTGNMLKLFVPVRKDGAKLSLDVYQPLIESDETATRPPDQRITLARSTSGWGLIWSFEVSYLSPLCLHVTLPPGYPSVDPPSYVISCLWLSPQQLTTVCRELDRLWVENKPDNEVGTPILYMWLDWLQENILSFLGLDSQISLTEHQPDDDLDDCRVVLETNDLNEIVTGLMRYNHQEELKEFARTDHECGVCFDVQTGSKFFLIPQCSHVVCVACMKEHCQILVKDGSVLSVSCPYYECKSSIPPYIIQQVLSKEQFQRFETLSLQKCLDVMGDIVWCPRCDNAVVREPEDDLNLAHCIICFYSFCTECGEKWHHGEPCKLDAEALEKLREELRQKRAKDESEREENMRRAKQLEEEGLSYSYIASYVSRCPSCRAKVMKIGGCNKVTCTNCHKHMCWICGKAISSYDHFRDSVACKTFTTDQVIDNTDIRQPTEAPRRPAPVHINQGRIIDNMIKLNPDMVKNTMVCLNCKQRNMRENNNNHVRCFNCKTSLCFDCKGKICGPIGKHFSGVNSCRQHTFN